MLFSRGYFLKWSLLAIVTKLHCSKSDRINESLYCTTWIKRDRFHKADDVRHLNNSAVVIYIVCVTSINIPYMLDQRPLLYKGRTQIVASLASKMKHLVK